MKIKFKLYPNDVQVYIVDSARVFNHQEGVEVAFGILEENGELGLISSIDQAERFFDKLIDNNEIRKVGDDLYAWDYDVEIDA